MEHNFVSIFWKYTWKWLIYPTKRQKEFITILLHNDTCGRADTMERTQHGPAGKSMLCYTQHFVLNKSHMFKTIPICFEQMNFFCILDIIERLQMKICICLVNCFLDIPSYEVEKIFFTTDQPIWLCWTAYEH